jgi:hypothetical protein
MYRIMEVRDIWSQTWTSGVNHDLEKNLLPEVIKGINQEEKDLSFSQIQFQK